MDDRISKFTNSVNAALERSGKVKGKGKNIVTSVPPETQPPESDTPRSILELKRIQSDTLKKLQQEQKAELTQCVEAHKSQLATQLTEAEILKRDLQESHKKN